MIERFQLIASRIDGFRPLLVIVGAISLVVICLSLIENPWLLNDEWLTPAIIGLCWTITLYSVANLFLLVPPKPGPGMAFRQRLAIRFRRGLLWILAILMLILSLAVVLFSYQLLRAW